MKKEMASNEQGKQIANPNSFIEFQNTQENILSLNPERPDLSVQYIEESKESQKKEILEEKDCKLKKAEKTIKYFQENENKFLKGDTEQITPLIEEVKNDVSIPKEKLSLLGKTVVVVGQFKNVSREELVNYLSKIGAKVKHCISKAVSYLFAGAVSEDGEKIELNSKYKKAKHLNIPIIFEEDLLNYFQADYSEIFKHKSETIKKSGISETSILFSNFLKKSSLWVDKYAPKKFQEIIGNVTSLKKFNDWLQNWDTKMRKFPPSKNLGQNPQARACLFFGPPGIGKTTAALLAAKEKGYDVIHTTAADSRSKKEIESLFSDVIDNETIVCYTSHTNKKPLILMDEVEVLSSTPDQGGIQALINMIKKTKIPIICICNNKTEPSLRLLSSFCYSLQFSHPSSKEILCLLQNILAIVKLINFKL